MLLLSSPTVHGPTSLSDTEIHTSTDGVSSNFNLCSEQRDQAFHWGNLFIPDWKVFLYVVCDLIVLRRKCKCLQIHLSSELIRCLECLDIIEGRLKQI